MIKLWHISDTHLSFDARGSILKDMSQRSWSKGAVNYDNYLEKITDVGLNEVSDCDFVAITGDLTHDAAHKNAIHSINWLRNNINGTLILIKGNHDRAISFSKLRMEFAGRRTFFIDEGEVLSVGPYTFGCYSNHKTKSCLDADGNIDMQYIEMAKRVAEQAQIKKTKAIMLSHYPVNEQAASMIGKAGAYAYLSGHIHCTNNAVEGGTDFTWYDQAAKPTDNNIIDNCLFSTGTTDVLLQLNGGKIFKHLQRLNSSVINGNEIHSFRARAANAFKCQEKMVTKFDKEDPFNSMNHITGFICRKKGPMQGALFITHVNGVQTEPQLIYGTPKLLYPYTSPSSREWQDFNDTDTYYVANKWNGMNVLFYKYFDAHGAMFISAKSKGTAFLPNTDVGNFLDLTKEVIGFTGKSIMNDIPMLVMPLLDGQYQGISFELCGTKEPHLVKYDFDIDLKPLFAVGYEGEIWPFIDSNNGVVLKSNDIATDCKNIQDEAFKKNDEYRKQNDLPLKYEYEHFATEGCVLYPIDADGMCIDRNMYKIKPKDIEEVHWSSFDDTIRGRVIEALSKINANGEEVSEQALQEELDMGHKEWSRFGKDVMFYADSHQSSNASDHREVIVLVGLPASGKSMFAKMLESSGKYVRINQDDLGSSNKCKGAMVNALKSGKSVVIDRVNFDGSQRARWISLAQKLGVDNIMCIVIDQSEEVCKQRITERKDHPTVPQGPDAVRVVDNFVPLMKQPSTAEGFKQVLRVAGEEQHLKKLAEDVIR
jgi:predicted kinase/predicted phosphohydrolase